MRRRAEVAVPGSESSVETVEEGSEEDSPSVAQTAAGAGATTATPVPVERPGDDPLAAAGEPVQITAPDPPLSPDSPWYLDD